MQQICRRRHCIYADCRHLQGLTTPARSGGSTLLRDPVVALGTAVVALPLLAGTTAYLSASTTGQELLPATTGWQLGLWPCLLLCALLVLGQPLRRLLKVVSGAGRRARMLQGLPGPSYGLLGILPLLQRRHDLHKLITEWAEEYGPVFRCAAGCASCRAQYSRQAANLRVPCRLRVVFFQVEQRWSCSRQRMLGHILIGLCAGQVVVVADPVLAAHVLQSRSVDKIRFQYHFLDPVRHAGT